MESFPRTVVAGVSMPRLICGCNSLLGFSHISNARDKHIRQLFDTPGKMADVIEVFARRGCNAFMSGPDPTGMVHQAIEEVRQRTGEEMIWVATPSGYSPEEWKKNVDLCKARGATFCFSHQATTDPRLDRLSGRLGPQLIEYLQYAKGCGLIPGLSTHTPESVVFADATPEAGVETYIQPYNALGFMCQVETDWIAQVISKAKKPVMTIKPLASGKLLPPTGLTFVWNSIRDCDMVTIGTMSTFEAQEVIELSLSILEGRKSNVELQFTRSKKALMA